jgi:8-oxo-dGTP diphosphatase
VTHPDYAARPDCAAGALFLDDEGRVLIVEPTYKARWEIPGGRVERGETPRAACVRELREELGLDLPLGRLLVVDWAPNVRDEHVRFVFDGGTLTEEQLDAIELAPDELSSWAFLPPEEMFVMMTPRLVRRVTAALEARERGVTAYLEHGVAADPEGADRSVPG